MSRNGTYKPKLCVCKFDIDNDFARTVEDGTITPRQIAELTARGIPVTPQAVQRDIQGSDSWYVDPVFRRNMDMATAWELEQRAQATAKYALARQKHTDFVKRLENQDK